MSDNIGNLTAQYLFDRDYSFAIGLQGSVGKVYNNLRIVFDIDKNLNSSPNKSKIEVYNLSAQSRISFQTKGLVMQLFAGYKNLTGLIFYGDVADNGMKVKRDQEMVVTSFECGDGERAIMSGFFQKSYPAKTKYVTIIQDIVASFGLEYGTVIGIENLVTQNGLTCHGPAKMYLDKILLNQGLQWSVQNNHIQIIPVEAHNGDEAVLLNQSSGLLGVPSKTTSGVTFISLLNPKIVPGSYVVIQSQTINGTFKVNRAHYEGDTHGDKWQVTCEAVEIKASQVFKQNQGSTFVTQDIA